MQYLSLLNKEVKMPVKVCILGNSGSGKSYLAKKLGGALNSDISTLVFLDSLYFVPERNENGSLIRRSDSEKAQLVEQIKSGQDGWIVEGVFGELIESFLDNTPNAIILFLDIDWEVCQRRIVQRPNNIEGVMDTPESMAKLLKYAENYFTRTDKRSHLGHSEIFQSFQGIKLRITSEEACNELLQALESNQNLSSVIEDLNKLTAGNSRKRPMSSNESNKLDRTTYTKKDHRQMRPDQVQTLIATEAALGHLLEEVDEVSLGCIVVHMDAAGVPHVLLLTNVGYMALPKGHQDIGEEELARAIRETNKETGTSLTTEHILCDANGRPLQASNGYSFVGKLHKDNWQRHNDYPNEALRPTIINHKIVRHFIAIVQDRNLKETVGEDANNKPAWFPVREALEKLTFDEDRQKVAALLAEANIAI